MATIVCCIVSTFVRPATAVDIAFFSLRAPGDEHAIEQASGLHYGRLGPRNGLWLVCDRNGGRSAGRLYFFAKATLNAARHREPMIADEAFSIRPPAEGWTAFGRRHDGLDAAVLVELRRRLEAGLVPNGERPLDLEAGTLAPSPQPPHEPRVFVVAEEPASVVLELAIDEATQPATARLTGAYAYTEAKGENGWDHNDGLEGLAYTGKVGQFYWAEEGTRSHTAEATPRLMFVAPRLGKAEATGGRLVVDRTTSDAFTRSVQGQRQGRMQTLNALTTTADGQILAVDRNGGWILRVDPVSHRAQRWLNLYDLDGTNLRDALASFPGPGTRRMPYISIEGIAVDDTGAIWLADDPAAPEAFHASCLLRLRNPGKPPKP